MELRFIFFLVVMGVALAGCATAGRGRDDSRIQTLEARISVLEQELRTREREFEERDRKEEEEISSRSSARNNSRSNTTQGLTVTQIQRALARAGYYKGPVDGKLGEKTRAAIEAFQRAQGLKVDGIVGAQTQKNLARFL